MKKNNLYLLNLSIAVALSLASVLGALPSYAGDERWFGNAGSNGQHGRSGSGGSSGESRRIFLDGTTQNYDLSGADADNGSDAGDGGNATSCRQPERVQYNLWGATGGSGGDGGNGGNGGNGGDAVIFYTNPTFLRNLTLNTKGGRGGQAGNAGSSGQGCQCSGETRWTLKYCEWDLYKKPKSFPRYQDTGFLFDERTQLLIDPNTGEPFNPATGERFDPSTLWEYDSSWTNVCTGSRQYDEQNNVPNLPQQASNSQSWLYQWQYEGISGERTFTCNNGESGQDGSLGRNGSDGNYGEVTLVPRATIPEENFSYTDNFTSILNQEIELVRNIWVRKSGLQSFLNPSSQVPDQYKYLSDTVRRKYKVVWGAEKTLEELGVANTEITGSLDRNNNVEISIPGTIERKIQQQGNLTVVNITGGFHPDRVQNFDLDVVMSEDNTNPLLVLKDNGEVRDLLKEMTVVLYCGTRQSATGLTVTPDYNIRNNTEYVILPFSTNNSNSSQTGLTIQDHTYTVDMKRHCSPWMKPGYDMEYTAKITQVTKSDAIYGDSISVRFQLSDE